ncbi:uncharacterized protein LOC121176750 isoform X2 [Toxotes jaculatrix]|uniref:uncharacterized protein LOC121176750 isoform X2 n=1 Tax=Toxotes jaculatrix TaxID=941984 RepID=UPI001B3AD873|nr:uncharacterized protein LOC121176750 isoform X2 [Toxotes jaculatrix]
MELWSRLCVLVLVISSMSMGQEAKTEPPLNKPDEGSPANVTASPSLDTENKTNDIKPTVDSLSSQNQSSQNATDERDITMNGEGGSQINTTAEGNVSTKAPVTSPVNRSVGEGSGVGSTTVSTASTSPNPEPGSDHSFWGYVILVLIILVIIVLCAILYFLRRVARTYSFDLQRPDHIINQFNEPTGTFEPVYLDDLDRPAPKDQTTTDDLSPPPVTNGTSLQSEEKGSAGDNAPQEQPDANGLKTLPTSKGSTSSDDDPADRTSDAPSSTNLLFDASAEPFAPVTHLLR